MINKLKKNKKLDLLDFQHFCFQHDVVAITLTCHIYRINGDFTIVRNFLLTINHNPLYSLKVLYVVNIKRISRQSISISSQLKIN